MHRGTTLVLWIYRKKRPTKGNRVMRNLVQAIEKHEYKHNYGSFISVYQAKVSLTKLIHLDPDASLLQELWHKTHETLFPSLHKLTKNICAEESLKNPWPNLI